MKNLKNNKFNQAITVILKHIKIYLKFKYLNLVLKVIRLFLEENVF